MAPADAADILLDENDDDFFGEYNSHPYQGGYDLAATFGTPLPPSANTCYPVSSSAAAATVPTAPSAPSPTLEPADPQLEEPSADEDAPREPAHESPVVFPTGATTEGKVRKGGRRGRGFWKKCVRVLDFIFCYKDPYADPRVGVDSYVVPVYADGKESGKDALETEVPPPAFGRVEPRNVSEELVESNDLSWHSNYKDDANTYSQSMSDSYYTPSFAQSYGLHGALGKPDWFPNFSYPESYRVEEFQHEHFSAYCDQSDVHILETPAHAYNIQSYTPISDMPLEPFKPSWSQNWGLYDAYMQGDVLENETHSGEYGGIGSLFISPFYPRETKTFEWAPSDEHASFHHNRHNLSYQNMPMDDVSLITQAVIEFTFKSPSRGKEGLKIHKVYHSP